MLPFPASENGVARCVLNGGKRLTLFALRIIFSVFVISAICLGCFRPEWGVCRLVFDQGFLDANVVGRQHLVFQIPVGGRGKAKELVANGGRNPYDTRRKQQSVGNSRHLEPNRHCLRIRKCPSEAQRGYKIRLSGRIKCDSILPRRGENSADCAQRNQASESILDEERGRHGPPAIEGANAPYAHCFAIGLSPLFFQNWF